MKNQEDKQVTFEEDGNLILSNLNKENNVQTFSMNEFTPESECTKDISNNQNVMSDSSEEDDEDEPPILKYTRISNLPKNFFQRDSISACWFHENIFAFATHSGMLHLTKSDFTPIRTVKCHRASILSIYIDDEFFATGSIDGTVVIGSIENQSDIIAFDFKRPVHSVVLDRNYKTTKIFISGGMAGDVIISQKNWLGNRIDISIEKEHGSITGIYTLDDIIFWMNDIGITFYSLTSKTQLLQVPFPQDELGLRPELYWPKVHFPEVNRIIVCWGNYIWSFKLSLTVRASPEFNNFSSIISSATSTLRPTQDKKIELEHHFKICSLIAGVAFFKDDELLVLTVSLNDNNKSNPPELKIINITTGEEIHNDEIIFNNYQNLTLNDYHLGRYIGNNFSTYYLISANDAICVQELTLKDRFDWFIDNDQFLRAWELGNIVVDPLTTLNTGIKHIEKLFHDEKWVDAASFINAVFKNVNINENDLDFRNYTINKWQEVIYTLIKNDQVDLIAPLIPQNPMLQSGIYDSVLQWYLDHLKIDDFKMMLHLWPSKLYTCKKFEDILEEMIEEGGDNVILYRTELVYLYTEERKYMKAITHMLKMKNPHALDLLISQNLLLTFIDDLIAIILLPYDGEISELNRMTLSSIENIFRQPITLLIQNKNSIKLTEIIDKLTPDLEIILFLFLKRLLKIDSLIMAHFESTMLHLYAKYQISELLMFLKTHSNYNIEIAIDVCEKNNLYNELIYLWNRIGESKKALSIIIDKLDDPKLAIDLVNDSKDIGLWKFLINYSLDKPNFIKALLESNNGFIDIILDVIKAMSLDIEIEGLQLLLQKITKENSLNLDVNTGIFKIAEDEANQVAQEFLKIRTMGKLFEKRDV